MTSIIIAVIIGAVVFGFGGWIFRLDQEDYIRKNSKNLRDTRGLIDPEE